MCHVIHGWGNDSWNAQEDDFTWTKFCNAHSRNETRISTILPLDKRFDHSMLARSSGASNLLLQAQRSHGSLPRFNRSLQWPCLITSTNSSTQSPKPYSILFALWIFENFASSYPVLVHFVSVARRVCKHDPLQCEVSVDDMLSTSTFLREFEDARSEIASNKPSKTNASHSFNELHVGWCFDFMVTFVFPWANYQQYLSTVGSRSW